MYKNWLLIKPQAAGVFDIKALEELEIELVVNPGDGDDYGEEYEAGLDVPNTNPATPVGSDYVLQVVATKRQVDAAVAAGLCESYREDAAIRNDV